MGFNKKIRRFDDLLTLSHSLSLSLGKQCVVKLGQLMFSMFFLHVHIIGLCHQSSIDHPQKPPIHSTTYEQVHYFFFVYLSKVIDIVYVCEC